MSRFTAHNTPLEGLMELQRHRLGDDRGFLERMFCLDSFRQWGKPTDIVQINRTLTSNKGVVRGMHFQRPPHAETKIVSCLKGEVFDVAVDLRVGSPTFLQWYGTVLSGENHKTLLIPEGFAHGFQTLSASCELLYLHTHAYEPSAEGGLDALDSRLGIQWPLPVSSRSDRDQNHPPINESFKGLDA